MKYLLSFSLAALAALCVTGCATKPASNGYTLAQTGGTNCRRFAQPDDTKIQIYCSKWQQHRVAAQRPSEDTSCRWLSQPADNQFGARAERVCGNAAKWDEFDTSAVNASITCRWELGAGPKKRAEETCLTAALWQQVDSYRAQQLANYTGTRSGGPGSVGANWPGSGVPSSGNGMAPASSYGYFPAGTAIGAVVR